MPTFPQTDRMIRPTDRQVRTRTAPAEKTSRASKRSRDDSDDSPAPSGQRADDRVTSD